MACLLAWEKLPDLYVLFSGFFNAMNIIKFIRIILHGIFPLKGNCIKLNVIQECLLEVLNEKEINIFMQD